VSMRLELRLEPGQKALLEAASEVTGMTLPTFVLSAAAVSGLTDMLARPTTLGGIPSLLAVTPVEGPGDAGRAVCDLREERLPGLD
jgi:hypothetical protein